MRFSFITSALLLAVTSIASPVPVTEVEAVEVNELVARQSATTCGSTSYTASQVSAAVSKGYGYYRNNQQVGSNNYPHTYNNYEGFNFRVSGPYQEFPLLRSGTYSGGSPGADRVVFNTAGQYGGAITHTGASSSNAFVGCSGTS
ncbi:related to Guanyl-specific ribonuclease F1 [Ramularia collo-cygni]|uniref:ribonuclease T1 n=1 Tax=Ramularia collo-cygni TaxID=112498 RepID=A0A2D3VFT5_9PEZI|nr:related to Guanyl-specific ribonuclease F1 [Ramularia collo-cygni]CZT20719.1 related to Guanyl-specific ribonuclease F1 [Ramularia collo-cygni]